LVRTDLEKLGNYLFVCLKWLLLSVLVGIVVGLCGSAFGLALNLAANLREAHPWLLYLLPLGGLAIVGSYHLAHQPGGGSTNAVFVAVRDNVLMPLSAAPLIFAATTLTHLFGGSAGREGAALQLGGSLAGQLGKALHLDGQDCRVMTMCGMAAGFSALFGTPLAATVFALEVVSVGTMHYVALAPCLVAALLGVWIAGSFGIPPTAFSLSAAAEATPFNLVRVLVLGILLAALSVLFCRLLHSVPHWYARFFPNTFVRAAAGGLLVVILTLLVETRDYNGAGSSVIHAAVAGYALPWAFALKMLFTALTLGAGFKGGEIVPVFFTGAAFGCVVAPLLGLPAGLGAALGMVGLFCGVTNCPLTSLLLSAELFGGQCLPLFALVCAVSYSFSGYSGLYSEQKILYSKLRLELFTENAAQ